jgi:hypothetical protein
MALSSWKERVIICELDEQADCVLRVRG